MIEIYNPDEMPYFHMNQLGDYIGKCPNCNRQRFCEWRHGKGKCEKCEFEMDLVEYWGIADD